MKASFKRVDINPPIGMQMAGYSERNHGAIGIHDNLYVSVSVIDDGINKIAYVVCDVIAIDHHVTNEVRKIVINSTDIKPENIMVGAIHTHSGPFATRLMAKDFRKQPQFDVEANQAYYILLIRKIAGAICLANMTLEEATIGYGTTISTGLGTNRNDINAYFDKRVKIIKVNRLNGELLGCIINYACHPTVMDFNNYYFTADFISYVRESLNEIYPQAIFIYSQGASGSASTRFVRKSSSFAEAKRLSQYLVGPVITALADIDCSRKDIHVNGQIRLFTLPIRSYPSDDQCQAEIDKCQAAYDDLIENKAVTAKIRKAYVTLQGAKRNYVMKHNIDVKELNSEMQILDFGVCRIIGIPSDLYGETARDIMKYDKSDLTFCAAYTNDFLGYIVSNEGFKMGAYEQYMQTVREDSSDILIKIAHQLIEGTSNND